jgi:ribosomal protein L32E
VKAKNSHTKTKKVSKELLKGPSIQYVLPLGGNGWVVKNNKAAKFTVITDSKREAISIARNIAKNKQIELVVHGRDGSVEIRENYANVN